MIGDGEVLAAGLVAEGAGEPTLADAGRAGEQQPMPFADPVAAGELQEQRAVEAAGGAEVDVLDLRGMAQPGGAGAALEPLLPAQRRLPLEQEGEPFGMLEGA